jgi:hypothetical protein
LICSLYLPVPLTALQCTGTPRFVLQLNRYRHQ